MAQKLLTNDVITRKAAVQFKNNLVMGASVNRQYDDQFARRGAKIGNALNIRMPQIFESKSGAVAQIQDIEQRYKTLVLTHREHVAVQLTSEDRTLSLDELDETILTPAATALANQVDVVGAELAKKVASFVGAFGTTPSSIEAALDAKARIANFSCPTDEQLTMMVDPKAEAKMVNGQKSLFQSAEQIAQQYEKGVMGIAAGAKWKMSQNVYRHSAGAGGGTPEVDGAQSGSEIDTKGWPNSTTVLKEGDIITFEGVNQVNPLSKIDTGDLMQFTVLEDVDSDGSGDATIKIYPAIEPTGQYQNVTAAPAGDADVTIFADQTTSGKTSPQNMLFHKNAFILGMADLYLPGGVEKAYRVSDKQSGISIRFVQDYEVREDVSISRFDVIFGWLAYMPEWACRVLG